MPDSAPVQSSARPAAQGATCAPDRAAQASHVVFASIVATFAALVLLAGVSGAATVFNFSVFPAQVAFAVVAAIAVLATGVASLVGSNVLDRARS